MSALDRIFERAKEVQAHIIFAEGEDPRIIGAAIKAVEQGLGHFTLLGDLDKMREKLGDNAERLNLIDPDTAPDLEHFAQQYYELRKHKGVELEQAREIVKEPLTYAGMMVRLGLGDGAIAGAVATTADTVRTAIQVVGKSPEADLVSSCFLMCPTLACPTLGDFKSFDAPIIFSDCGLVVEPNAKQLADIGKSTCETYGALIGGAPKLAFLSFSTMGSAKHLNVKKVQEAASIFKENCPEIMSEGDLQFDAAFDAGVRAKKAPDSPLEGSANIYVFPNLDAGNIGYKIAQRIGGMMAVGPILQGLDKPFNDLSRGCNVDDIIAMITLTSCQTLR